VSPLPFLPPTYGILFRSQCFIIMIFKNVSSSIIRSKKQRGREEERKEARKDRGKDGPSKPSVL